MRSYSFSNLFLIFLLFSLSFLTHADNKYNKVYIFGDSLSDTGNLASIVGGIPAPYFNNRISNGPVAVDTLTAEFGDTADASLHLLGLNAGNNYSVAGAKASTNEVIDLNTQILSFQANHASQAPSDALYLIFIGGNDIRAAIREPDIIVANSIIETAVSNINNSIILLKQMGARSFLIVNAPNIGELPETKLIAAAINNPEIITHATDVSKKYNKHLHQIVENIEDEEDLNIIEYNLFKFFSSVIRKSSKLGFTNNSDACFLSNIATFNPECNFGLNANQFVFFDEIHPTARVHSMLAKDIIETLEDEDEEDEDEDEEENEKEDKEHI